MYVVVVALTMLVCPVASIVIEHYIYPGHPFLALVGQWFVFWGVGVRLTLAGARQFFQPAFTATEIFHMKSEEALPLVRELGVANVATGVVGLLSLGFSSFVLPISVSAGLFYGIAGFRHTVERNRSRNENIAMVSDLFLFFILAIFIIGSAMPL